MKRKGNPDWCKGGVPIPPAQPTQFERMLDRLQIFSMEQCLTSRNVREWVGKNYKRLYVPEQLLKAYEMPVLVDDELS